MLSPLQMSTQLPPEVHADPAAHFGPQFPLPLHVSQKRHPQSALHVRQFSPWVASQKPLPQQLPQSPGQVLQLSPALASQTPLPQQPLRVVQPPAPSQSWHVPQV
jgi:hypothetical protein